MLTNKNCDSCNYCIFCDFCNSCDSCNYCDFCNSCNYCIFCDFCNSCDSCNYCDFCNSCNSCDSCNYCDYCKNLKKTEYNIFCASAKYNDKNSWKEERYRAFNQVVGKERYNELVDLIKKDIFKDVKLELNKNSWEEEWKKVTPEQWQRLSEIPEFDIDVVEMVVGFRPDITPSLHGKEVTMTVDGKEYKAIIQ